MILEINPKEVERNRQRLLQEHNRTRAKYSQEEINAAFERTAGCLSHLTDDDIEELREEGWL